MGRLTLILGGARSGKSRYAMQLARQHGGRVTYIATAQNLDTEMQTRIENHRRERPPEWQTLEIPRNVGRAFQFQAPLADLVLLDCLTMLVSNVILETSGSQDQPDELQAREAVQIEIEDLLAIIRASQSSWIVVSNEVGMGLVPPYPLGRLYRDLLGWANQMLAAQASQFYFMVAGIPLPIHRLGMQRGENPW
jgi:adenosylcobinamide kinase/adenosylcobinamide-phosphate guanylyltransferase